MNRVFLLLLFIFVGMSFNINCKAEEDYSGWSLQYDPKDAVQPPPPPAPVEQETIIFINKTMGFDLDTGNPVDIIYPPKRIKW